MSTDEVRLPEAASYRFWCLCWAVLWPPLQIWLVCTMALAVNYALDHFPPRSAEHGILWVALVAVMLSWWIVTARETYREIYPVFRRHD